MENSIGILVIHGMGNQRPGFANGITEEINKRLEDDANSVVWQEVHWARALKSREDELWDCMQKATEPDGTAIPLDWKRVREFVVHNFGDAIAYQRDWTKKSSSASEKIHSIVSANIKILKKALPKEDSPIIVVAHSLGAHIMSNYIWDRQHTSSKENDRLEPIETLAGVISFGCNIPLFSLAFPVARPIKLPGQGVKNPALIANAKWINFLDRDDVLGWPLKPVYEKNLTQLTKAEKETVARIEDYEINVGSMLTSWDPAAHSSYWTDDDLTRPTAKYLRTLIRSLV